MPTRPYVERCAPRALIKLADMPRRAHAVTCAPSPAGERHYINRFIETELMSGAPVELPEYMWGECGPPPPPAPPQAPSPPSLPPPSPPPPEQWFQFKASQSLSLNEALVEQYGDMSGIVAGVEFPAGDYLLAPSLFDANTSAAEIWLLGNSTAPTVLRLSPEWLGRPLVTVSEGAPPIYFSGLTLLAPILVEAGGHAKLLGCTLANVSGDRALTIAGGDAFVSAGTTFEGNSAGAVRVDGGSLEMDAASVRSNRASRGAALLVTSGIVRVSNSTLQTNTAAVSGGAVQVDGGELTLASGTVLLDNQAPAGAAISYAAGELSCE